MASRASPLHADQGAGLLHIDDDFFLPQLRQGLGGLFPGVGVFDRGDIFVLVVGQQLGLHVSRQLQVLGTNRPCIAPRQVGLPGIAEDEFASQLGGVRVFGVFVDDGGVAEITEPSDGISTT